jgi:hypothetical protein
MTTARIRSLLAATAVAALLAYGMSAHGMPQMNHEGMAGAAAGLCLLLVTILAPVALPITEVRQPALVADEKPRRIALPQISPDKASPRVLRRFRN